MATIDDLKTKADLVANATEVGENTATRVGSVLVGAVERLEEQENNISELSTKINGGSLQKYNNKTFDGFIANCLINYDTGAVQAYGSHKVGYKKIPSASFLKYSATTYHGSGSRYRYAFYLLPKTTNPSSSTLVAGNITTPSFRQKYNERELSEVTLTAPIYDETLYDGYFCATLYAEAGKEETYSLSIRETILYPDMVTKIDMLGNDITSNSTAIIDLNAKAKVTNSLVFNQLLCFVTSTKMVADDYIDNGFAGIINTDGTLAKYGACYTSALILLRGNLKLKLTGMCCGLNKSTPMIAFYDNNKTYLSAIQYPSKGVVIGETIVDVPTNASYYRISVNTYKVSNFVVAYSFGQLTSEMVNHKTINKIKMPYFGKRILSLGDSYTWHNYYGSFLAATTGCTQRGRGQNGACIDGFINDSYTGSDGKSIDEVFDAALLNQYDIITIMGGTNDYGQGKAIGAIDDEEAVDTVYGHLHKVLNKIMSIKPTIKLFFCTQPYRCPSMAFHNGLGGYEANSNGATLEDVANAVVEFCRKYGVPVLDFYHTSGWNLFNNKVTNPEAGKPSGTNIYAPFMDNIYTSDGLHPRNGVGNGADMLGTAFGNFINTH